MTKIVSIVLFILLEVEISFVIVEVLLSVEVIKLIIHEVLLLGNIASWIEHSKSIMIVSRGLHLIFALDYC